MARTLFTDVNILDCTGADPYPGEVLVEGNRIRAVVRVNPKAKGDNSVPPEGAEMVDGDGATLMPGLTEAHAHLSFLNSPDLERMSFVPPEEHTLMTMAHAKLYLDQGFTSCVSAASAKPRLDVVIRNAINAGQIPGPRLLANSPEMGSTGGLGDLNRLHRPFEQYSAFGIVADGADEFRRISRAMIREGTDLLKFNPSGDYALPYPPSADHAAMTDEEVAAVVSVAHGYGRRCCAHARGAESVILCLRHGVDIIYHATLCNEEALDMLEAQKDRVFVAPAIGLSWDIVHQPETVGLTAESVLKKGFKYELDRACDTYHSMRRRGIRVLPGGDYGIAYDSHGKNARDLEHFINLFGYTPMEAIMAATKLGGEIMLMSDELGQIQEGFLADILLVSSHPETPVFWGLGKFVESSIEATGVAFGVHSTKGA